MDSDTKESDLVLLGDTLQQLISQKKERQLKDFLGKENVRTHMIANAWEIVPDLCANFSDERERSNPGLLLPIEEILLLLSETCIPKELLILFVEQIKEGNDALFRALLLPVQKCLFRITSKRAHSLALVLKGFSEYIETLPLPKQQVLEGRERLLLDLDESVQRIVAILPDFLDFLSPLVVQLSWKAEEEPGQKIHHRSELKEVKDLTACLIHLLSHPLAYLDLSHETTSISNPVAKSTSRVCAENAIRLLGRLHPDLVKTMFVVLVENERREVKTRRTTFTDLEESTEDADTIPVLGLSTLAYLLFSENLLNERIPRVYSTYFMFEFNLPFVLCLLQKSELLVTHKGLSLCAALLRRMTPQTWSANFLECTALLELIKSVVFVASSVRSSELNALALQVLVSLLKMFETCGRVKLLHYLLTLTPRGRVTGYIITMLRDEIDDALKDKRPGLFGPSMEKLLMLVFALPNGEKTDLLDNSDRIMGALNLLRFLLLHDGPNENATGIWSLVPLIEQKYFQVLGAGIRLSRAHYELQLKQVRESRSSNQKVAENSKEQKTSLTKHEQIRALQLAINTFDMMEGILGKATVQLQSRKTEKAGEDVRSEATSSQK